MSYCRFGEEGSDVYVFGSSLGIECCGCSLRQGHSTLAATPQAMIAHLAEHKGAGHYVPIAAIERLWLEVVGPKAAVRPEPEVMTRARQMLGPEECQDVGAQET